MNEGGGVEETLKDLDKAEVDVFKLLSIVQETCEELQEIPSCDMQKISALSNVYFQTIKELRETLVSHSDILEKKDKEETSTNNVDITKAYVNVSKSLEELAQKEKEFFSEAQEEKEFFNEAQEEK